MGKNREYVMEFFVELSVRVDADVVVVKRTPAKDWQNTLAVARSLAVQMFPEHPMADRAFRGNFVFVATTDLGHLCCIRPLGVTEEGKEVSTCPNPMACGWPTASPPDLRVSVAPSQTCTPRGPEPA